MHCIKCGAALPPGAATCPACGAATPYNVAASTPEAFKAEPDPAVPGDSSEEQVAPPAVSQVEETPQVERTVLQQPPQPEVAESKNVERTVLQEPSPPDTPVPQVERTVLQQPPQPDKAQPAPVRQQGSPQPALPSSSPAWQQPQPIHGQQVQQPAISQPWPAPQVQQQGAPQAAQGQPWPQPFPGQQPQQPWPWPQQGQQPVGPQSYPAWQQPQQQWSQPLPGQQPQQGPWQPQPGIPQPMPWPQSFPGQQSPQQGPWQPQPGVPQPFPGQQGQPWPQPFLGQPQPAVSQPLQGQSWPQPFPGQPQFQSSPAWQQPQMGRAQPVPAQQVSQATPAPAAQALPVQQAPQRQGLSLEMILLLIIIALVVIGGSGLLYYAAAAHPANLHAQATSVAQDFLTVQARSMSPQSIYNQATSGKPAINDPLSSANGSIWSETSQGNGRCLFTNGAFHASSSGKATFTECIAKSDQLSNFVFQAQMTIANGLGVGGGLLFRVDNTRTSYYAFVASSEGIYYLGVINSTNLPVVLNFGPSSAIKTGLNQSNLLTVIALGDYIYLYVNKQYIATVNDGTYKSGSIGLFANSGTSTSADVAFNNAQVWKL